MHSSTRPSLFPARLEKTPVCNIHLLSERTENPSCMLEEDEKEKEEDERSTEIECLFFFSFFFKI